ncbi:hypothetical protein ACH4FA_32405 [Streptomyces sp. NPDC017966]
MNGSPYTVSGVMTRAVVAVGRDTPFDGTVAALETDGFPRRPAPAGA